MLRNTLQVDARPHAAVGGSREVASGLDRIADARSFRSIVKAHLLVTTVF